MSRAVRSFSTRLVIVVSVGYLISISVLGLVVFLMVRLDLTEDLVSDLETEARTAQLGMPESATALTDWTKQVFDASGLRVTVIDISGRVVADSHTDPSVMENHGTRPEVITALQGETGHDQRLSASTGFGQIYVALPPRDDLILRLSVADRVISESMAPVTATIVAVSLTAAALGILVALWVASRFSKPIALLTMDAQAAAAKGKPMSGRVYKGRELRELSAAVTGLLADTEARARQSERDSQTLEIVLAALPQGTILVGGNDHIVYANPSAEELLGVAPEKLSGLAPFSFQEAVRESRSTGAAVTRETDHGRPTRRLRAVALPLEGEDDRVLLIIADITARARTESVRRDFVANASHELKTPLASIIASSEALRRAVDRDPDSAERFAGQIESAALQLDRMVGDLLDLSRLERESPEKDPIRLDLLCRDEVDRVGEISATKGVEIDFESVPVIVLGSRRDLAIAIRNVLDNAVRHTPPGGRITVSTTLDAGEAVVAVSDTGEGIPTREIDRIFERFYRVDAARSRHSGGTGLGLAIVKHVMQGHGGAVDVESQLGVGSTFRLRLPVPEEETSQTGH